MRFVASTLLSPNLFNLDLYTLSLIRIITCNYYEVVMIDYYQFLSVWLLPLNKDESYAGKMFLWNKSISCRNSLIC